MERTEVQTKLASIFRDIFANEALVINDATTADKVEGWDSLNHINLIVAVEKGFKVSFTTKEIRSLQNVGDFVNLVTEKTKA